MKLQSVDPDGVIRHDCIELMCETSLDGEEIRELPKKILKKHILYVKADST